jgi:hypothetical protein
VGQTLEQEMTARLELFRLNLLIEPNPDGTSVAYVWADGHF